VRAFWKVGGTLKSEMNTKSILILYNCQMGAGRCENIVQPAK